MAKVMETASGIQQVSLATDAVFGLNPSPGPAGHPLPRERGEEEATTMATLEEAMPEMLDEMLARFQEVGVSRILRLADEMVRARLEVSATSHLTRPGQTN